MGEFAEMIIMFIDSCANYSYNGNHITVCALSSQHVVHTMLYVKYISLKKCFFILSQNVAEQWFAMKQAYRDALKLQSMQVPDDD